MEALRLRADFERDGYVAIDAAVGTSLIEAATNLLRRLPGAGPSLADAPIVAASLSERAASEIYDHPSVRSLAEAALGSEVVPFGVSFLRKPARTGLAARWHQDAGPWKERLGGAAAVTVWIALDDATVDNGCLLVIPGSHRGPTHDLTADEPGAPSLFRVGLVAGTVDDTRAVALPLPSGGVVVHHPNLIHRSGPNHSDRARTALAVRYRDATGDQG